MDKFQTCDFITVFKRIYSLNREFINFTYVISLYHHIHFSKDFIFFIGVKCGDL